MKRLAVTVSGVSPIASIWLEGSSPVPGPVPDLILEGDDLAGQLYWAGVRHDLAELIIDISNYAGLVLNRQMLDLKYPRLYKAKD